jgi:cellulose synthase/poly-beta-1,6-N-acetylglucosamine synthase-like glycosyltransferase
VTVRHYLLILNRLFGTHRQPYLDLATADWPQVTIYVPCRDEKQIGPLMVALLAADYPSGRLTLVPIVDPGFPDAASVLDEYAVRFPGKVIPFHRARNQGGRGGALREASEHAPGRDAPIHLVFDGAYRPGRGLLKQLVAPFFDPEVGAVFSRIVPANGSAALLPRLLDLAEAEASQIEQQARTNLGSTPEIAAPVMAVRRSALESAGGWNSAAETECLELGYRLAGAGWSIAYQNRAECYQDVQEEWPAFQRELRRNMRGRITSFRRHATSSGFDGLLRLGRPFLSVLLLVVWGVALAGSYTGDPVAVTALVVLTLTLGSPFASWAGFVGAAAAARLDGNRTRIRLLPFQALSALAGTCWAAWEVVHPRIAEHRSTVRRSGRAAPTGTRLPATARKEA